ncbi:MAG: DUF4097 family beta strand repeat protein [Candidatus Eiseniibacteriota bacterium]|nr:MAG: DUF4097 family beta strand repeat protein [Candidatus Eisenbacteria bacterium]
MRTALATLSVLVITLGLTSCCCIEDFDIDMEGFKSEFDRTYSLASGGKVEVQNVDGFVHVESWDRDEVLVKGTLRVRAKNEEEALKRMKEIKVVVTQEDDYLSIQIKRKDKRPKVVWFGCGSWRVDLDLTVPRRCNLSLSTVDGAVRVSEIEGSVSTSTVDGSIRVEGVRGDVRAHSVDGSCTVIAVEGDVDAGTTDGTVEVLEVRGDVSCKSVDGSCTLSDVMGSVKANSVDGRIRIEGVLSGLSASAVSGSIGVAALDGSSVTDSWKITTVDGSVTLKLPETISADIKASTIDGRVSLGVPAEFQLKSKRSVVATLGKGGGTISISTTDGSIRVGYLEAE